MAFEMCSESPSLGTSPRISFSHDHVALNEISQYRSDSNSDFNFCVGNKSNHTEPCSADELFSGGLILPLQIQERFVASQRISPRKSSPLAIDPTLFPLPAPPNPVPSKQETETNLENKSKQAQNPKSFWGIKRSTSLHGYNTPKKGSFWSFPLLLRSNSTGSVPNSKPGLKQNSNKQRNLMTSSSSSSVPNKPPLKKKIYGGYYGNMSAVRINPVLNVTPPYISRGTTNLFGLGSLFRNGKDKKNKK
ncbi:Membrane-associated kinase regulator [Actinidia chinensis var. chinensis]|uniref:Membrane-associated kinase regulator n=1 Tax=Actinidia chinensis var. chinensis TaxID=1590841 RepID=A0A2R6PCE4_ACTCC|nr:Membrane-associated kinase regulator [Actinidia chinensis var. chinensis]